MRFCVFFQIPWILTWNFHIKETEDQIKQVFKTIKIKWWDKYTYTYTNIKAVKVWLYQSGKGVAIREWWDKVIVASIRSWEEILSLGGK